MIVPGPGGRDDKIAGRHQSSFTVDCGIGALTFDNESQRGSNVSMGGRNLAGPNDLQPGKKIPGNPGFAGHSRVFKNQYTPLRFLRRYQIARFHQIRPDSFVLPVSRHAWRLRLLPYQAMQYSPERRNVLNCRSSIKVAAPYFGHAIHSIHESRIVVHG